MAEYTHTDNPNFNVKEELKKAKKIKNTPIYIYNLSVNEYNKVRKEWELSKEGDVVIKVDKNTGRKYYWDTKLNREVSGVGRFFGRYGGESIHDRVEKYWRKKYNIPSEADRQQAIKDIQYLEARLRYEQREEFRTKKLPRIRYNEKGKPYTVRTSQYEENIRRDKEKGNLTDDGVPISQAQWDGKTNELETNMVNAYENSSYKNKDFNSLNIKVQNKVKKEKKIIKEKTVTPPVKRDDRYMEMQKRQKELDETINKNPMRNSIKVGPKDVGKTHSLDNLLGLKIEQ